MTKTGSRSRRGRVEKLGIGELLPGDCRKRLTELADESVSSIVSDAPYEVALMGLRWDDSGVAFDASLWSEALRVLKPGGHMLIFGATRTFHRLACAIEDAGFEVRDTLHWTYGQGFPKSKNLKGSHVGWGTQLKPSHELILLARKPLDGTVEATVMRHGTGALNIDASRVGSGTGAVTKRCYPDITGGRMHAGAKRGTVVRDVVDSGRFPANTLLTHSAACVPAGTKLVRSAGAAPKRSSGAKHDHTFAGGWGPSESDERKVRGEGGFEELDDYRCASDCPVADLARQNESAPLYFSTFAWDQELDDQFAPIRFCAKPSKSEKRHGVQTSRAVHATVKPVELMRWLIRLVTPKDGVVADPFLGSGTTAVAAELEGIKWIGCELTKEYLPLIRDRVLDAHTATLALSA